MGRGIKEISGGRIEKCKCEKEIRWWGKIEEMRDIKT